MTFKIHFEHADGTKDFVVLSGDTIKEIQEKAEVELKKRVGINPWSEEIL